MDKKRKIIILIIILILAIVIGAVFIFSYFQNQEKQNDTSTQTSINSLKPTLSKIYEKMLQEEIYTFSLTLDENNKTITTRNGNNARIDFYQNGVHTTDIIKDGSTYRLIHNDKQYFEYPSNTIELTNLLRKFERTKEDVTPQKGEETIEGKNYYYEEYKGTAEFLTQGKAGVDLTEASTKFYYDNDSLVYIKTIVKEKEELLKVEMSYTTEGISFEIPTDYEKIEV